MNYYSYRFVKSVMHMFFLSLFLVVFIVVSLPVFGKNNSSISTDTTIPRVINIVYDDSGSMVPQDKDDQRWCSAMYALEVFTAMMGEKDTINIYRMSEYDSSSTNPPVIKTIKGNESTRVNQVHNMECDYGGTPFNAVKAAAEDLSKVSVDNDRWLVILTDGDSFFFDDLNGYASGSETTKRLTESLNEYAKDYKVAYLGIGSKAASITSSSPNLRTWTAKTGDEILSRVTEIGNGIFEHQILPDNHMKSSGNKYILETDIPTKQIFVFAQGENVSIGDMKLNGENLSGELLNVKYVDEGEKGFPQNTKNTPDITNYRKLKGVVAVYDAKDIPFADGVFEVNISGASKIEFYYKAGVVPTCILYDEDGNVVDSETDIAAGEYTVEVGFVNPLTGKAISSDMLNVVSTEVKVINNEKELDIASGRITLEEGNTEISTSIQLEGNVKAESYIEYKIKPKAINLEIQIDVSAEAYKAQNLGENEQPVIVTLIDNTTGTVITKEQWDACKVKISGSKDDKFIEWDCKKGNDVGIFEIRPLAKSDKSVSKIESGKHYFEFEVNLNYDEQRIEKKASGNVLIEAYTGTRLVIASEEVNIPVRNPAIPEFIGIKATVYMVDDTGQQIPITEEIWKCLKIKPVKPKTKRVSWTVEKGNEVGTYIIKPDYPGTPWKFALFMYGAVHGRDDYPEFTASDGVVVNRVSNISTGLKATGELGAMTFSGDGITQMMVAPLTGAEIWALVAKYVISFAILLTLIIGYSVKPRIQRGLKPHIVKGKAEVACKVKIRKKYIPFIAETAIVTNFNAPMKCPIPNMRIKAYDNETFVILNANEVLQRIIKINGAKVGPQNVSVFKNMPYAYEGFNMQVVAPAGERVGKFHMT